MLMLWQFETDWKKQPQFPNIYSCRGPPSAPTRPPPPPPGGSCFFRKLAGICTHSNSRAPPPPSRKLAPIETEAKSEGAGGFGPMAVPDCLYILGLCCCGFSQSLSAYLSTCRPRPPERPPRSLARPRKPSPRVIRRRTRRGGRSPMPSTSTRS
jgi:hypothetical protein